MHTAVRTSALAALLIGLVLVAPPLNRPLSRGLQAISDFFDQRPERRILFVGNSRTFFHDMPEMVRWIADSAGFAEKLHIEMHAPPGASIADHWGNPKVRELIGEGWQHVIIQVQSGEQTNAQYSGDVWQIVARLIQEVSSTAAKPAMFVTWRYTDQCPVKLELPAWTYADMHRNIQLQHASLARTSGAELVNVGMVWEQVQIQSPGFSLYEDCNHPSVYGSYLSALMFYAYFSGDVEGVTYHPDAITAEQAELLRSEVSRYVRRAGTT